LSADAIFAGREPVDRFTNELEAAVTNSRALISLAADSVAEAVAFACAVVLDETFAHDAVVITHDDGWRYVEKNPQLRVAIASSPEIAARAVKRDGLAVVAPLARGDLGGGFSRNSDPEFRLERPDRHTFEQALIKLGLEQSDAERLAQTAGRSWSVVRRQRASNSAIRRPTWLTNEHAWVVSTLCLVNSWVSDNSEDQRVVAQIAGRSYEEVERALASLADLDDSPVLKIGRVWKAKAPVEVLDLFGSRITAAELQRYLAVVQEVLSVADPVLELPEEQRSAAAMYGKERPHSGLLFRALADGLAKLAVRGELVSALADMGIEEQVKRAVKNLLHNADATRWLSLDDVFRPLAEAAPEVFIASIEGSLAAADAPVSQLIKETSGASVFGGRCWQADLLWALEILAWSPQYLTRVCLILAKLSHVKTESTWNNSPFNTLLDIFRAWRPQTAATVQQRLRVLDTLIAKDPEVAFKRIQGMIDSMTKTERVNPDIIDLTRRRRIAAGSGTDPSEIKQFLNHFDQVRDLMKKMAKMSIWERIKMVTGMSQQGAFMPGAKMPKNKGDTGHRKSPKERAKDRKKGKKKK
jgi:hypothetical protein